MPEDPPTGCVSSSAKKPPEGPYKLPQRSNQTPSRTFAARNCAPAVFARPPLNSPSNPRTHSKPIAAAPAASASGFLQTTLSKVPRRAGLGVLTASSRRGTSDKVLTFYAQVDPKRRLTKVPLCDRFRGRLARKLECLDVTQSGPDAPAQSVGRVAQSSGNVRQPNHVLAN